jgi:Tfp pilus assembly protein PilO
MKNLPNKQVGLVAAGVSLFLVVIWWLALMSPMTHKLAQNHKAQASAQTQISSLQGQIVQLKSIASQKPEDQNKLNALTAQVPDNPQLDVALNSLQDAANAAGVQLTSVGPSSPNSASSGSSGGLPAIAISVTCNGSYSQIMAFVTNLDKATRTFVVTNTNISGTGAKLSAQIGASVYYAGQPTP